MYNSGLISGKIEKIQQAEHGRTVWLARAASAFPNGLASDEGPGQLNAIS